MKPSIPLPQSGLWFPIVKNLWSCQKGQKLMINCAFLKKGLHTYVFQEINQNNICLSCLSRPNMAELEYVAQQSCQIFFKGDKNAIRITSFLSQKIPVHRALSSRMCTVEPENRKPIDSKPQELVNFLLLTKIRNHSINDVIDSKHVAIVNIFARLKKFTKVRFDCTLLNQNHIKQN